MTGEPWSGKGPFRFEGRYLLADLEREFGPEAFTRFWTSDADVPVAFEQAFGMPLETWIMGWVESTAFTRTPGPGMPFSAKLGGLLTLMLFAAIVGAWARGRTVTT